LFHPWTHRNTKRDILRKKVTEEHAEEVVVWRKTGVTTGGMRQENKLAGWLQKPQRDEEAHSD
jgi:hypothetical protein